MRPVHPTLPWHSRFDLPGVTFILFLLLTVGSLPALKGSGRDLDYLENLFRFGSKFFPPDWSILPYTLHGLWETLQIAVISTFVATLLSLFLSLGAARTISPNWLVLFTRMLLNMVRFFHSKFALGYFGSRFGGVQLPCWGGCLVFLQCRLSRKVFQ